MKSAHTKKLKSSIKSSHLAILMALATMPLCVWAEEVAPSDKKTEVTVTPAGADLLEEVEVKAAADRETATSHVNGYVAKRSATASKTDTPIIETPRSISVITADQIESQSITNIDEALRYTAGTATEYRGIDRSLTDVLIRGFDADTFTDGMRADFTGFGQFNIDPYGLERVEVLKGPASILYGAGSPGGMINIASKRPTEDFFAEVGLNAGTFSQRGGKFDVGGALDDDKNILARLTGVFTEGDSQVDFTEENRTYLAPALTWKISDKTALTLLTKYQKDEGPWASFLPAVGTALHNPNGKISTSLQIGEPNYPDGFEREFQTLGYIFEHTFANTWLLSHSLRYSHYNFEGRSMSGSGFAPLLNDNRTIARGVFYGQEDGHGVTTDTNLQRSFPWGSAEHTVLLGVDYKTTTTSAKAGEAPPQSSWNLDIFNPVYGVADFPSPEEILRTSSYRDEVQDLSQTGFYAQDQIKVNQWVVSLGTRYDEAETKTHDHLSASKSSQQDHALTTQAGALYLFDNGFAPYASYAESFRPEGGTDIAGQAFKPTTATQYEVGVKYQPPGSKSLITLSVFEITQQNVLTPNPVDDNFSIQTGEVRTRGVEVEAKLNPWRNLDILAAYTYLDSEVTKSTAGDEGYRFGQTPKFTASLWANYQLAGGFFDGLILNAGVRHTGSSLDYPNVIEVPSFTLWDAGMRYDFKGAWRDASFTLNAQNLTDETYVASCEGEFWCIYGPRRVVTAGISYRW